MGIKRVSNVPLKSGNQLVLAILLDVRTEVGCEAAAAVVGMNVCVCWQNRLSSHCHKWCWCFGIEKRRSPPTNEKRAHVDSINILFVIDVALFQRNGKVAHEEHQNHFSIGLYVV